MKLKKAWGGPVGRGLNPSTREGLVWRKRWDFPVVMSTVKKNQKFFVRKLGGPTDKALFNYLQIRCVWQFARQQNIMILSIHVEASFLLSANLNYRNGEKRMIAKDRGRREVKSKRGGKS